MSEALDGVTGGATLLAATGVTADISDVTTTLVITDLNGGALTIGTISDTVLDSVDLSGTIGAINLATTGGLTQSLVAITMGAGADTIKFAQSSPSQTNADTIQGYNGAAGHATLQFGTTRVLLGSQFGTTETVASGFDTSDTSVANFLAHIIGGGTAGVAAYYDGTNTWVASVKGTGDLTNVVELVGVHLTSVSTTASATVLHIG